MISEIASRVVTNQPTATTVEVADDLRMIHEWSGLTMADIARALRLGPETVRRWYRFQRRPSNFAYTRLLALKKFAQYSWMAMPFNTCEQRRRWWLRPANDLSSPLDAFRTGADGLLLSLIERSAPVYGRAQLAQLAEAA